MKEDDKMAAKRDNAEMTASPNSLSPPTSRIRCSDDFAGEFLSALGDPRVVQSLTNILLQPLLDRLDEREKEVTKLKTEVVHLQTQVSDFQKQITKLQIADDEHEQYSRRNSVRLWIRDDEEKKEEDTDAIVLNIAQKAGVKLQANDIDRSHRVGKPNQGKARPIICKFTSYSTRDGLYQARKKLVGCFVSEDLTQTRSKLLYLARQERNAGRFKHTWSRDGRIQIRLMNNTVHTVVCHTDLEQLIKSTPLTEKTPEPDH